ncbi:piggyBac transposable element-derived protein 3-like [Onthophagus taurus]|uniref:piggyBac transposable element-derived protein 3-like n=1 Tax=Onthophagus taurus TaxID=166361 RepID=UPI0039BE4E01
MSGYNSVVRYKMYWEKSIDCNYQGISSLMSRNRFEELLRYFHVADNANLTQDDRFAKVRPLWDLLNKRWLKYYPGDRNLSIDESMIPYYGKHGAKQHIHGKPIRFGYKTWSICTRLGYLIHGELYQGASTGNTHPEFGVGGSVVLDLLSRLPPANYSLYMDNFFTSLPLLNELKKLGHDATGTIRENRVEKAPLNDKKEMKRGSYHQCTNVLSGITLVRYNDNNIVRVASTESGVRPIGTVKRYCNKQKKAVDQPCCIVNYNKYMGGVDRLDQNVGCYRVAIRLKRWYWQLLMFPLNVSVNNAFQLYKISPEYKNNRHDLLSFTRYIVTTYFVLKDTTNSTLPTKIPVPKSSLAVIKRVADSVRLDGSNHFIGKQNKQSRCALCHKNTTMKCIKCSVALHHKCSTNFHTK